MAYIDSKLAEARSVTPADNNQGNMAFEHAQDGESEDHAMMEAEVGVATASQPYRTTNTTSHIAQQQSASRSNGRRPRRSRRPQRGADDVARDSMIDQIMHEAKVPLYSEAPTASHESATADGGEDNDDAAAEAFKAQLLAEMQMQNRNRRKPAAAKNAAVGGKDAKISVGPKLGGSRMQREKMKALEEAKGVKK
jgi:hypothetical protein